VACANPSLPATSITAQVSVPRSRLSLAAGQSPSLQSFREPSPSNHRILIRSPRRPPSRYDHLETSYLQNARQDARIDRLTSDGKALEVQVKNSSMPFDISAYVIANDPLGRGDRRPSEIHLIVQSKGFSLTPAKPVHWELSLTSLRIISTWMC
jgi:hypothetical protein